MASFKKRDSGRWQVQVRKKGYPTQTKSFRSKAVGARWVRSIEYEMDQGLFVSRLEWRPFRRTALIAFTAIGYSSVKVH